MGRRPATVIEYRSYELPSHFPMRIMQVRTGVSRMSAGCCTSTTVWRSAFAKVTAVR